MSNPVYKAWIFYTGLNFVIYILFIHNNISLIYQSKCKKQFKICHVPTYSNIVYKIKIKITITGKPVRTTQTISKSHFPQPKLIQQRTSIPLSGPFNGMLSNWPRSSAAGTIFTFRRQRRTTTLSYLRFPIGHVRERAKNHFPRVITTYRFSAFNSPLTA